MAITYAGYTVPAPSSAKNLTELFRQGFEFGGGIHDEQQAGKTLGDLATSLTSQPGTPEQPSLSQFGLPDGDTLRGLLQNPETRQQGIEAIRTATAARAEATDPLRKLQLKKAEYDVAHQGDPAPGPGPTAEMRNFEYQQKNPAFAEFIGKSGAGNAPADVQTYLFYRDQEKAAGREPLSYIDFKGASSPRGGAPSPTIAKEIFEADEGAQAGHNVLQALDRAEELNKTAWDGPFADTRSAGGALFGNKEAVDTQTLQNVVTANALESLRATFGGNPTEGERKILLEVQGSVNQARSVREEIFKRARTAAERRVKFNEERARGLRTGEYFDDGYSPVQADAPTGIDDLLQKYGP